MKHFFRAILLCHPAIVLGGLLALAGGYPFVVEGRAAPKVQLSESEPETKRVIDFSGLKWRVKRSEEKEASSAESVGEFVRFGQSS